MKLFAEKVRMVIWQYAYDLNALTFTAVKIYKKLEDDEIHDILSFFFKSSEQFGEKVRICKKVRIIKQLYCFSKVFYTSV